MVVVFMMDGVGFYLPFMIFAHLRKPVHKITSKPINRSLYYTYSTYPYLSGHTINQHTKQRPVKVVCMGAYFINICMCCGGELLFKRTD